MAAELALMPARKTRSPAGTPGGLKTEILSRSLRERKIADIPIIQTTASINSREIVANSFVQLLNCIGIETEHFADSTGQLDLRA